MSRSRFLALLLAPFLANGCDPWQTDATFHGVAFRQLKIDAKGGAIGRIDQPLTVGGRPCDRGWLHLHPNGIPAAFTAAAPIALPRLTLPPHTWVRQDPHGTITTAALPADMEIQGHRCRGNGGPKGITVSLYPGGALRAFFPPGPTRIDGVPCRAGLVNGWVELHENGRLKSALLDEGWTHAGIRHPPGVRLQFDPGGTPHAVPAPAGRTD